MSPKSLPSSIYHLCWSWWEHGIWNAGYLSFMHAPLGKFPCLPIPSPRGPFNKMIYALWNGWRMVLASLYLTMITWHSLESYKKCRLFLVYIGFEWVFWLRVQLILSKLLRVTWFFYIWLIKVNAIQSPRNRDLDKALPTQYLIDHLKG